MIKKIRSIVLTLAASSFVVLPALAIPAAAFAAVNVDIKGDLCSGTNFNVTAGTAGADTCSTTDQSGSLNDLLAKIINIFSIIVGVIAVIMIIVGGLRYITSGGESGKVGSAKTTILYALVGLVVVALAQLIVHFVLGQAGQITG